MPQTSEEVLAHQEQMMANAEKIVKTLQTPQGINILQPFDGNPVKLHSFLRSVDNIMPFIDALEATPYHNVWVQAIRNKIIGDADTVLEVYGTPLDWKIIKANLISHYNDKRDATTLTRELFLAHQTSSIEDFYGRVQHLLSLLVNHANIAIDDPTVRTDRIKTHSENALQVFLAGLKEPIGGNIRARRPETLKSAFDACIEEQNFLNKSGFTNNMPPKHTRNPFLPPEKPNHGIPRTFNGNPLPLPPRQQNYYAPNPFRNHTFFRPHPPQEQKPVPMEVDKSIRSANINYANRPPTRFPPFRHQQPFRPFGNPPMGPRQPFPPMPPRPFGNPTFPHQPFRQTQAPKFIVEELTNLEHDYSYHPYFPEDYYYGYNGYDYSDDYPEYHESQEVQPNTSKAICQNEENSTDEINFSRDSENPQGT